MIARGFIAMHHVVSKSNVADIVTKHWGHSAVYHLLRPVFGHEGDTDELYEDCLLYTSDAADERSSVDLGGRRII